MKPTRDADDDSEATQSEQEDEETETQTEDDPELFRPPPAAAKHKEGVAAAAGSSRPQQRLGAARHTPAADAPLPPRPTSRQLGLLPRWSEMDLPEKLTYSYKGAKGAAGGHVTEEERERRRVQAQREKAEAEEAVKSRIRRAVSARFRGRMQGGPAGGGTPLANGGRAAAAQATPIQPAWVRVRAAAGGVSVAWHPAAHPLSLPMAVRADASSCLEPIDLQLQAVAGGGQQWRAAPGSNIRLGCELHLQPSRQPGSGWQQQPVLQCVGAHGGVVVGCLLQQQVLDALETVGYLDVLEQQQQAQQTAATTAAAQPPPAAAEMDWQRWRAVVRSLKHAAGDAQQLTGVTVRLLLTP